MERQHHQTEMAEYKQVIDVNIVLVGVLGFVCFYIYVDALLLVYQMCQQLDERNQQAQEDLNQELLEVKVYDRLDV